MKIVDTQQSEEEKVLEEIKFYVFLAMKVISTVVILTLHPVLSSSVLQANTKSAINRNAAAIILVAFSFAYVNTEDEYGSLAATALFALFRFGLL